MGRRKIEMKRINNKEKRKITWTKRRKGLLSKAAELCDMCGAGIVILTVSPGGQFHSFGHPDVDSVIARYCGDEASFAVDENRDCVTHEDDDEEDSEGEQERESEVSSDEVDEPIDKTSEEEEELIYDIEQRDLISHFNEERDGSGEFWWDKEEPVDPDQVLMYYQSLMKLRSNVAWVLDDRKTRESYAKDYISMI